MDWHDVIEFCGFNTSANSYITRYLVNVTGRTLTPCAESAVVTLQNIPLLYLSLSTVFVLQSFRRIMTMNIWYLIVSRLALAVATVLVFGLSIFLGLISKYPLRAVVLIEYSVVLFAWLVFSLLWLLSLHFSVWTRTWALLVAYGIAVSCFALISLHRYLQFGFYDVRTLLPISIVCVHIGSVIICIFEWHFLKYHSALALLDSDISVSDDTVRLPEGGDQHATFLSRIFFCWTNDLIKKGYRLQLNNISDLFKLPSCLEADVVEKEFIESAPTRFVDDEDFSLTKTLLRAFGAPFFALGALKLVSDVSTFAGPILLHLLVVCLDDEKCDDDGYNYSLLMMLSTFLSAITSSNFNYYIAKIGLQLRSAISTAVYDKAFGAPFFALGALKLVSDVSTFAGPILLHLLVVCLDDEKCDDDGYNYSLLMMLSTFLSAITSSNFNYYIAKIGLQLRSAISTAVYDKLLRVRLSTLSSFSSGQVLNFMSADVDRIVNFCGSFHAFWSLPLQLGVALYLLYREVGLAFLSGLAASLLLVPLNKWITSAIGRLSAKMMQFKDQRVKLISETVRAIRTVKLSNWEDDLEKNISVLRDKELRYLKGRKYLDAVCVYLWASAPVLITVAIFSTYTILLHEKLTAAKVFTSLALVNILIMPLNAFPWALSGIVEAFVSIRRLDKFFDLENIDVAALYSLTTDSRQPLQITDAKFSWRDGFSLNNVTLEGNAGTVIGLTGPVGSGKSTFLLGILGETDAMARHIGIRQNTVHDGFAYVSQNCWLRRGTVRDNIVCGAEFDARFYEEVVRVTALKADIQAMPGGDEYEIGDGGCTLSGGQRARVALARALYQDREIYLLDDPFASVDAKVGRWMWDEAVMRMLRARNKLVIVATHRTDYLKDADHIIMLDAHGNIIKQGSPSVILPTESELQACPSLEVMEDIAEVDAAEQVAVLSEEKQVMEDIAEVDAAEQVAVLSEEKQRGKVRLSVYGAYMRAAGVLLSLAVLAALSAMQASKNVSDWWLSRWAAECTQNDTNAFLDFTRRLSDVEPVTVAGQDYRYPLGERPINILSEGEWDTTMYFLLVYAALALCNTLFTLVRAFIFAYGGIVAASNLHNRLLHRVLNASMIWWERTPCGRVINRLCSDVYVVDDSLPFQFNIFLASSFNLIGSVVITFIALPFLSPVVVGLSIVYFLLQRYYRYTTCEVKRLTSVSLSPLYGHIADTIAGLSTIRAFRFVDNFASTLRRLLNDNVRAQYSSLAAAQWLSIRLQILGVVMVSAVAISALLHRTLHYVDAGMVGLAITYALSVTNLLNSLLSSFIETEKELISVERMAEYIESTPQESNNFAIPMNSDINGRIDFACVSLRYGAGLPLALENISFRIEAGTRVAIIGRTGSGKSSLIQALLRANPIDSGRIFIDGVDINSVELHSLRSIFGIVTQTPFVFSGTLRENLCLAHDFAEERLHKIAEIANFGSLIKRLGGIDGVIEEGGSNLSFGEKQIISICRLVLARPKIVIFDEATAHMDSATHARMTELVRCFLPTVTIISIIHRIEDIHNYDSVIRMEAGKIAWQGPPSKLTQSFDES
ncbi:Multidrug resistance-associated protein 7 [Toxocara canis]|uniref:ABC-type xenobiotic transporter n=1 Tax=Toxocara canis TaxID=6265 RepID=A0A0B2UZ19_TOXCA|nr:Multidrug resistance-associated protein 7 [Toxocara canis]